MHPLSFVSTWRLLINFFSIRLTQCKVHIIHIAYIHTIYYINDDIIIIPIFAISPFLISELSFEHVALYKINHHLFDKIKIMIINNMNMLIFISITIDIYNTIREGINFNMYFIFNNPILFFRIWIIFIRNSIFHTLYYICKI